MMGGGNERIERHGNKGYARARCWEHGLNHDHYMPQLQRLLRPGRAGDRRTYDSLVSDVVTSRNPLDLFEGRRKRCGVFFIEALYRTHAQQAQWGDTEAMSLLAPLCYSRWLAWRRFRDALRSGSIRYGRNVDEYIRRSREDVIAHLRAGWQPTVAPGDEEFDRIRNQP